MPFGTPVPPEEYAMWTGSSGCGRADRVVIGALMPGSAVSSWTNHSTVSGRPARSASEVTPTRAAEHSAM
nr:hypothetical protein [Nocardia farcinica]